MEDLNAVSPAKNEKRGRYELVVRAIREKHGGLEDMRARLGFTQKQMSELLLVDPSAWTRWVRDGESAPAHIYQALAWYLESRGVGATAASAAGATDKIAWKMAGASIVEAAVSGAEVVSLETWEREKAAMIDQWQESQKKAVGISDGWKLFLLMNSVALVYLIFSQIF